MLCSLPEICCETAFRNFDQCKILHPPNKCNPISWFDSHLIEHQNLVHPNWEQVYKQANNLEAKNDPNELWCDIARTWMSHLVDRLTDKYTRTESDNFILISVHNYSFNESLLIFLERTRKRLLKKGTGILNDDGFGKYVVIAFADTDSYYDYVSYFGPQEGVFGMSSGMFINGGYGHFVFFESRLDEVEQIAAHEMTHALLDHLPIPLWLNEGMAVSLESVITGVATVSYTHLTLPTILLV